MKMQVIGGIAVLIVLAMLVAGCGGGGLGGGDEGTVQGRVRNHTGTPLPGATVSAGGAKTTTDNDGWFSLGGVSVGTQVVSATLAGYFNDGRGSASVVVVKDQTVYLSGDLVLVPTVGGEVYLRSLKESSSDFDTYAPQQQLGGTVYFNCLATYSGSWWWGKDTLEAIYSLGRRYNRFKATVGVSDTESDLAAEVIFKVIGDGNVLYQSNRLKVGKVEAIDVDVSTVLTLQLQVTRIGDVYPAVVWADPRVTTK